LNEISSGDYSAAMRNYFLINLIEIRNLIFEFFFPKTPFRMKIFEKNQRQGGRLNLDFFFVEPKVVTVSAGNGGWCV